MGLGFRGFGRLSILQVKFGLKGTFVPILLFRLGLRECFLVWLCFGA